MQALAAVQLDDVDDFIAHERGDVLRLVVHEHADRLNFRVEVLLEPRRIHIRHMPAALCEHKADEVRFCFVRGLNILFAGQSAEFQLHFTASRRASSASF